MHYDPYSLTIGFILGVFFCLMLTEPRKKGNDDEEGGEA